LRFIANCRALTYNTNKICKVVVAGNADGGKQRGGESGYNPFSYLKSEKDILKLLDTLIANTAGSGEKSNEDF
jgi:hypothetical protein